MKVQFTEVKQGNYFSFRIIQQDDDENSNVKGTVGSSRRVLSPTNNTIIAKLQPQWDSFLMIVESVF